MTILSQLGISREAIYNSKINHSKNFEATTVFDTMDNNPIKTSLCVFIDGSAINNGKHNCRASYAAVFPHHENLNISGVLSNNTSNTPTNNRAEYMACIKALEQVNLYDPSGEIFLEIYSDSKLLIDSMTKWISNWRRNGWKTINNRDVLNKDLLETLDELLKKRKVVWEHVRAHTGYKDFKSIWNDKADQMAKEAVNTIHKKI